MRAWRSRSGTSAPDERLRKDWVEVRTVDGSVWRFMVAPAGIPNGGRRGEIGLQAKVNTDGVVFDVTTVKNTTGSEPLAVANAEALKNARFYPLIQNRQHVAFTYQHHVYY